MYKLYCKHMYYETTTDLLQFWNYSLHLIGGRCHLCLCKLHLSKKREVIFALWDFKDQNNIGLLRNDICLSRNSRNNIGLSRNGIGLSRNMSICMSLWNPNIYLQLLLWHFSVYKAMYLMSCIFKAYIYIFV